MFLWVNTCMELGEMRAIIQAYLVTFYAEPGSKHKNGLIRQHLSFLDSAYSI